MKFCANWTMEYSFVFLVIRKRPIFDADMLSVNLIWHRIHAIMIFVLCFRRRDGLLLYASQLIMRPRIGLTTVYSILHQLTAQSLSKSWNHEVRMYCLCPSC